MFTGLISGVGTVREIRPASGGSDTRVVIAVPRDVPAWAEIATVARGASIACSGCCLTVIEAGADWFAVEVSGETLSRTTLGRWQPGRAVNLERALRMGDELGGHMVSGHVDGLGAVSGKTPDGGSTRWHFSVPHALARFIAPKGSVAVDGVSLTVNEVDDGGFGVNIIPHTESHTNFGGLAVGDAVNIEIDMLARYVARLAEVA